VAIAGLAVDLHAVAGFEDVIVAVGEDGEIWRSTNPRGHLDADPEWYNRGPLCGHRLPHGALDGLR
jgi:hypothetical protein